MKKHNLISVIGTILLNLVFLAAIIFFISTQIQVEQSVSQFIVLEGEVFNQSEQDGIRYTYVNTGVSADNLKTWKIKNDIPRENGTKVTFLIQTLQPESSEYQIVEVSRFVLEKKEEGFYE